MGVAIFWVLFAVAVGFFANNRGRGGLGWFFLSLLISPLLGLLFCAVTKDLSVIAQVAAPSSSTHIKCPACAEFVLPAAKICKHCGSTLGPSDELSNWKNTQQREAEARETTENIGSAFMLVGIVLLCFVLYKCVG